MIEWDYLDRQAKAQSEAAGYDIMVEFMGLIMDYARENKRELSDMVQELELEVIERRALDAS